MPMKRSDPRGPGMMDRIADKLYDADDVKDGDKSAKQVLDVEGAPWPDAPSDGAIAEFFTENARLLASKGFTWEEAYEALDLGEIEEEKEDEPDYVFGNDITPIKEAFEEAAAGGAKKGKGKKAE